MPWGFLFSVFSVLRFCVSFPQLATGGISMRLGLISGYSGAQMGLPMDTDPRGRARRLRLRVDRRGLRLRRDHAAGVDRRADQKNPARHRYHADARANSRRHRDDRDDARRAVGRPLHPRYRAVGSAGGRGLAWRVVRQTAAAHARVHRDRAHDSRARSTRSSITARNSTSRIPVPARRASASRSRASCTAARTCRFTPRRSAPRESRSRRKLPTA